MEIGPDKVVSFHYSLSKVGGEQLESTERENPMTYLHGHRNILPALEQALAGKTVGENLQVTLEPAQAYGERIEDSVQRVPIKHLRFNGKLKPGMVVKFNSDKGPRDARVVKVGKFNADLDMNHPLAGMALSFDIEIVDIREATAEETAHHHVHGEGGHHH